MNARKIEQVKEIKQMLEESPVVFVVNYTGLSVAQISTLRHELRVAGSRLIVGRNTLAAVAAREVNRPKVEQLLGGQIAFVVTPGSDDVVAAAKALTESIKKTALEPEIVGGEYQEQLLSPDDVKQLSKTPSREVLVIQMLGLLNSPMTGMVSVLNNVVASLPRVLQAVAAKK